jgi:hypothetical protein
MKKLSEMTAADYAFSCPPTDACDAWCARESLHTGTIVEVHNVDHHKALFVRAAGNMIEVFSPNYGTERFYFDLVLRY